MEIRIFDVEHGGCALLIADTGGTVLIDCGHNASTGWRPSEYLPQHGIHAIDRFFLSNYDEDHVSDLAGLKRNVSIRILHRNNTVSPEALRALKPDGLGSGLRVVLEMCEGYCVAPLNPPNLGALQYAVFCNNYPSDFTDTNNLSLVVFFHYPGLSIVFPGDLERAGWRSLLRSPDFQAHLSRVNVLVASHHGRESGCCPELFDYCRPQVVIMSDKATAHDTQETAGWYRARTSGIDFHGERRHVFTTRRDGRILLRADGRSSTIETF